MKRRTFLGSVSTVSTAVLAGCTGDGGGALPFGGDPTNVTVGTEYVDHRSVEYLVDRVEIARRLETTDGAVRQAESGSMFVFAHVIATNTEGVTELPGVEGVKLLHGSDQIEPATGFEAGDEFASPVSGPVLEPVSDANPGTSTDGWIVFEAPDTWSSPRVAFEIPPADDSESETVAEWRTEIDPATLPDIDVIGVDSRADTVGIGENATFDVAFSNDGGSNGTWAETATIQMPAGENRTERLTVEVATNQTQTQSVTVPAAALGNASVRVGDATAVTTVEPASLALDETLDVHGEVNITVTDVQTADRVIMPGIWGNHDYTPASGNQYALVRVEVFNGTGTSKPVPSHDDIAVTVGGDAHHGTRVSSLASEIVAPVEGRLYESMPGDLGANTYFDAWVICGVPTERAADEFAVSIEWAGSNGPVRAKWS